MTDCYEKLYDPKYYNGEFGTLQQPHLLKITYGQKFKNSLNFHCKMEEELVKMEEGALTVEFEQNLN